MENRQQHLVYLLAEVVEGYAKVMQVNPDKVAVDKVVHFSMLTVVVLGVTVGPH